MITGKIALDRQPLRLRELTERVVATMRATGSAERHSVTVTGGDVWIHADATRIEQVISNLLTNALKYTPAGGSITLSIDGDSTDAILQVKDTGGGISTDLLPRVFDLFVQGDQSPERAHGGLGIGLTLVRRLTELHQGQVDVASRGPDGGTTFTVRLPRAAPPPPAAALPAARGVPKQRIMIVEDNADARDMLRTLLELDGHIVYEASDGAAGLDAIVALRPDVALVDIGLPGVDGFEVARRLRAGESGGRTKLVALTGYGQEADTRRTREAGFDLHLIKPIDPDTLANVLAMLATDSMTPSETER